MQMDSDRSLRRKWKESAFSGIIVVTPSVQLSTRWAEAEILVSGMRLLLHITFSGADGDGEEIKFTLKNCFLPEGKPSSQVSTESEQVNASALMGVK